MGDHKFIQLLLKCLRCLSDGGQACTECIDVVGCWAGRVSYRVWDFMLGLLVYTALFTPILILAYLLMVYLTGM
jgi:hypothetical protein